MPIYNSIIPETETHILFPVVKQAAHYLINSLGMNKYIKNNIFIDMGWTTVKGTQENHSFLTRANQLQMKVTTTNINQQKWEYNNWLFSTGEGIPHYTINTQYPNILADINANIFLYEMYLPCTLTCECNFLFVDRNLSYEVTDKLQHRYSPGTVFTISLIYDYPVPKDMISLLYSLYKYRRFKDPLSFYQYFQLTAKQQFGLLKHRAADIHELCFEKTILDSLISIESGIDKPSENKVNDTTETYEVPCTLIVQFERASQLMLKYPCAVDNQLIDSVLIPQPIRKNDEPFTSALGMHPLPLFNQVGRKYFKRIHHDPLVFPFYDDWKIPEFSNFYKAYFPTMIFLYLIDESGETTIDLLDLPEDYKLHPLVIEILKLQKENTLFKFDSIFNITFFRNNSVDELDDLSISDDLKITFKTRAISPIRHMVLSEIRDFRRLNLDYVDIVNKNKPFFFLEDDLDVPSRLTNRIFKNRLTARGSSI